MCTFLFNGWVGDAIPVPGSATHLVPVSVRHPQRLSAALSETWATGKKGNLCALTSIASLGETLAFLFYSGVKCSTQEEIFFHHSTMLLAPSISAIYP